METIDASLKTHVLQNEQEGGYAKGKTSHIDKAMQLVSPEIPDGQEKIAFKHTKVFECR